MNTLADERRQVVEGVSEGESGAFRATMSGCYQIDASFARVTCLEE